SASRFSFRASTQARNDGLGFPRRNRLARSLELQTVIREGKRIRTTHLDVRVLASPLGFPRVGIVVPRHKHSIVDRNRLKRRLRELVRTLLLPPLRHRPPLDVAIRTRPTAYSTDLDALRRDVIAVQGHVTDSEAAT